MLLVECGLLGSRTALQPGIANVGAGSEAKGSGFGVWGSADCECRS